MVLFIMLYKVIQTFKSVEEILKCDHLNKLLSSTFLCAVYYAVQGDPNF